MQCYHEDTSQTNFLRYNVTNNKYALPAKHSMRAASLVTLAML